MNIGVITYRKYDERLLLNWNFNLLELFNIILNDKDFVRFEIFDTNNNLLLSTHYTDVEHRGVYIQVVKIEKEKEITGITYDAFRTPSTMRRIKVRWNVKRSKIQNKEESPWICLLAKQKGKLAS